jgi:glutamate-5-semialdehyde dehydrogenase
MEEYLMINVNELGKRAKEASAIMNTLGVADKNRGLLAAANALIAQMVYILAENEKDVQA